MVRVFSIPTTTFISLTPLYEHKETKKMAQTKQTTKPKTDPKTDTPEPSKMDALAPDHPLHKAHAKAAILREERAKLSDAERTRLDLKKQVRKAAKDLTTGLGNVANRLRTAGDVVSRSDREKIVAYLEEQVEEVKQAAFGKSDEANQFDL